MKTMTAPSTPKVITNIAIPQNHIMGESKTATHQPKIQGLSTNGHPNDALKIQRACPVGTNEVLPNSMFKNFARVS